MHLRKTCVEGEEDEIDQRRMITESGDVPVEERCFWWAENFGEREREGEGVKS